MAEITTERRGLLVRGVFEILTDHPEGLRSKTVLEKLRKIVPPTEFELSEYPNRPGSERFGTIVRFSTITSVKAGWLLKEKGTWTLTDAGRKAFKELADPVEFIHEARKGYRKWQAAQPEPEPESDAAGDAPDTTSAWEEAEEAAWDAVRTSLDEMNPYDFQKLVAGLLEAMDYHVTWIAPPGPDRGFDILAHLDPLGVKGPRIKVQVKRQESKVGAPTLREFMAVLGDSDVGIFVATAGFTRDAELESRIQERRRITLLDAEKLFDLWVEHYEAIDEEDRQLLPLRPVYFLAPES